MKFISLQLIYSMKVLVSLTDRLRSIDMRIARVPRHRNVYPRPSNYRQIVVFNTIDAEREVTLVSE